MLLIKSETMKKSILEDRYNLAKERVEAIKAFYISGILYCIIIPMLWYINYQTTSFPWAIFPSLGWGFGLLLKGLSAKGINPLWGKQWERRKIDELMRDNQF